MDVLTVYLEGTANTLKPTTTQIGELFANTAGVDITDPRVELDVKSGAPLQCKMGFDGCGVTNGLPGVIWAFGLATQCDAIRARVDALISARHLPLRIVVLGLSRGGIGALMLAQRLRSAAPAGQISLHLCLFDPVPGNLIITVRLFDWFGISTAKGVMDVSDTPIERALAIYPHEALPDLAFHAPIMPRYPSGCELDEDSTLGCHQGALYPPSRRLPKQWFAACALSQHRVIAFLEASGTRFVPGSATPSAASLAPTCLQLCEEALGEKCQSTRASHAAGGVGTIVRHHSGRLLNNHHRILLESLAPDDPRVSAASRRDDAKEPVLMLEVIRGYPHSGSGSGRAV